MNTPTPTNTCRQCGGPMASNAPEGLCARCLLSVAMKEPEASGMSDRSDGSDESDGSDAARAASLPHSDIPDIADAAEVARRLPQFEILELLGRGGMGVVYKARQLNLDRIVALKILPPADALTPDFVERFRREARSLAKLSHPNIVSVHDFGEGGGLYYFVMEHVDGVNLRAMIRAGKMKPEEALAVVPKICDALQFAHEEGVVHRDIKPENILIDKRGRVKTADFGLAKLLRREQTDNTLTMSGMTLGTPRYMAPEQMDKPETVDHRADIYSLGVVFYEMLTGEVPMGRFAPPSERVQIDVRLDEIVLHALERDADRRYQHASQVRDDVERVTSKAQVAPVPQNAPPMPAAAQERFRGLAIASLVLGTIGLIPVFGAPMALLAVIHGIVALVKKTTARSMALTGVVLGASMTILVTAPVVVFPFISLVRHHAQMLREVSTGASSKPRLDSPRPLGMHALKEETSLQPFASAADLLRKVSEKYGALSTFSATGKIISIQTPASGGVATTLEKTFSLNLARPEFYRVQWTDENPGLGKLTGWAWSAGDGHKLMTYDKVTTYLNREQAVAAATGISGGVAFTVPNLFFKDEAHGLDKILTNGTMRPEESVGANLCYVVSGDNYGNHNYKNTFWITKKDLFLKQSRSEHAANSGAGTIHGGEQLSDETVRKIIKMNGREGTPEEVSKLRKQMESGRQSVEARQWTSTTTFETMAANELLIKEDFEVTVPAAGPAQQPPAK